jgi:hypothetical protein
VWEAAWQRPHGTAAEYTVVPARQTVLLGAAPSLQLGAALGIPFLTAHRCLTLGESVPDRLGPGTLDGRTVLVQGGAGAVGNAAIQLARWAAATVIAVEREGGAEVGGGDGLADAALWLSATIVISVVFPASIRDISCEMSREAAPAGGLVAGGRGRGRGGSRPAGS